MYKILIPARLNSQRLKRKLLEKVDYKTIIQMTWEVCLKTHTRVGGGGGQRKITNPEAYGQNVT